MKAIIFIGILIFSLMCNKLFAQEKIYTTRKITGESPNIDGIIDEDIWSVVEWSGGFTQREPYDGKEPSQKSAFKIIYDDNNLFVAIRAYDTEPEKIDRRLSRRDDIEGDLLGLCIDSYYDKLTSFSFTVNAAGVKVDAMNINDNDMDATWNPIWYVKTSVDSKGWVAEMKIPLSQLRFAEKQNHIWGLQVFRSLFRKEEFSVWEYIPQEESGWVSKFGELHGISGIKPKKDIEIMPYVVAKVERFEEEEGNPFATGKSQAISGGVDGKVSITNDLTMNFTINPDFGQVEADPSEVNLSAFESYFEEKRPFFIEGKNIFNFNMRPGDGDGSRDNLFYSRRIGRRPQYDYELADDEYADYPENTRILGAFKLSGKTKHGVSIGVLESITRQEFGEFELDGNRREISVEPFTNYFLARAQKDFDKGNTTFGGMITATNRKILEEILEFLPNSAYTGGLDFTHYWKNKSRYIGVKTIFSNLSGTKEAITGLQESSTRYYQRPDAEHLKVDTNLTSISGHGGTIQFGKISEGHWRYGGWVSWRSPGLELNDMGYMRNADEIQEIAWINYRIWEPFGIFRSMRIGINQWSGWDFSGKNIYNGGNINFNTQFKNYWHTGFGINRMGIYLSRNELRGGPGLLIPSSWRYWFYINTDNRKRLQFELTSFNHVSNDNSGESNGFEFGVTYRPSNAISISVLPFYDVERNSLQYVTTIESENDDKYIVAEINRKILSTSLRIDFSLSPDLSIQYWGQPFIFSGDYSEFKRITNSQAKDYNNRFHQYSDDEIFYIEADNIYEFDENLDGEVDFSIDNPNFNFFQFRSNLVIRWEYIPGSTVYFVWSQGRTGDDSSGIFSFNNNMTELFDIHPHNIFLIKFSYRFIL
ncbi:MAG: carbohydrate binding family 9 domain-containing protein [Bacteroidales bacterium]|nr:carbohydrate binding family 9 domain-containing protein [Bacteroidales bacterium]